MISVVVVGMQFNNLITPEKVKPFLPICPIEYSIPCLYAVVVWPGMSLLPVQLQRFHPSWMTDGLTLLSWTKTARVTATEWPVHSLQIAPAAIHEETICSDLDNRLLAIGIADSPRKRQPKPSRQSVISLPIPQRTYDYYYPTTNKKQNHRRRPPIRVRRIDCPWGLSILSGE